MTRVVFIDEKLVLLVESELPIALLIEAIQTGGWVLPATLAAALGQSAPRLRAVRLGRLVVATPAEPHDECDAPESLAPVKLSPRQIEVLQAVADGYSNKEIALRLALRECTVEHHLIAIRQRFGTKSRMQSVLRGIALGLCKFKE